MAKDGKALSAEENDLKRRAAKARQEKDRKAAAHRKAVEATNYKKGVKFERDDRRAECEANLRRREAVSFGLDVNACINGWLDAVDGQGATIVELRADNVQDRAIIELSDWVRKNPRQGYAIELTETHFKIAKVKKAAA